MMGSVTLTKICAFAYKAGVALPAAIILRVKAATWSVAEHLLKACKAGIAEDFRRIKEADLKKIEAESQAQTAEAARKVAEAAEVANRVNDARTREAKLQDLNADIEIKKANARAIDSDAKTRRIQATGDSDAKRIQAIAEAYPKLVEAIKQFNLQGGTIYLDAENLNNILRLRPGGTVGTSGKDDDDEKP